MDIRGIFRNKKKKNQYKHPQKLRCFRNRIRRGIPRHESGQGAQKNGPILRIDQKNKIQQQKQKTVVHIHVQNSSIHLKTIF